VDKQIMLVAQKSAQQDDPKLGDLYSIGTLSTILQLIKLPDGTLKVLVEGNKRASIESIESTDEFMFVKVNTLEEETDTDELKHFLPSLKKQC
jgi:ATP-dependent Lon protease